MSVYGLIDPILFDISCFENNYSYWGFVGGYFGSSLLSSSAEMVLSIRRSLSV